ncbi:MAG: hypothetical protein R2883_03365 [Caldisericia bacterium]
MGWKNWVNADGKTADLEKGNCYISKNAGNSWNAELSIDSSNNPHIVWDFYDYENDINGIAYVRWNRENWLTIENKIHSKEFSGNVCADNIPTDNPMVRIGKV